MKVYVITCVDPSNQTAAFVFEITMEVPSVLSYLQMQPASCDMRLLSNHVLGCKQGECISL